MEKKLGRLSYTERDGAFRATPAVPRLPPPVLGRDGKITFPPMAGFGDLAPKPAPYVPAPATQGRMQFVPAAGSNLQHPMPVASPTVQVDVGGPSGDDGSYPATPRTPGSQPPTPRTPTSPITPLSQGDSEAREVGSKEFKLPSGGSWKDFKFVQRHLS